MMLTARQSPVGAPRKARSISARTFAVDSGRRERLEDEILFLDALSGC
jgi:hypothetical protein